MPVPTFDQLIRPILALAAEGEISRRSAADAMAERFHLSDEERDARIPSGSATYIGNRSGWAMTFLTKARLIEKVVRGTYRITDDGRSFLTRFPDAIRVADLQALPGWEEAWGNRVPGESSTPGPITVGAPPVAANATPEDRIDSALAELDAVLRKDLLDAILEKPPRFFEELVLEVLGALGYGGTSADSLQHTGGSGDEGIDGVINEDALGLDKLMLQAKRYRPDRKVDREAIQAFVGSLVMKGVDRGVFITTSSFADTAKELVSRPSGPRVVLIDGKRLVELMIEKGIGVRTKKSMALRELDRNYFDDE
ncbi:MAG: restriction endonuclease [Gemmatimonadaceae bacterium]|nr:restriction endonuclease [Gemmatimonadaceae bacterium]